jgi:hypothetical protein
VVKVHLESTALSNLQMLAQSHQVCCALIASIRSAARTRRADAFDDYVYRLPLRP